MLELSEAISWFSKEVGKWIVDHGLSIVLILIGAWAIRKYGSRVAMRIIRRTVRHDLYPTEADRRKRVKTLQSLVNAAFHAGTWILAILLIISELRPNYTAAIFASAGVVGLAVGFGAQSLIKDFVSGIFIITENQYRVGDVVRLDSVSGTVEAITIRTTVLRDLDGSVHHVPNGAIVITTNKTFDYSRLLEEIAIIGDTKLSLVEKVINDVGKELTESESFAKLVKEAPKFDKVVGVDLEGNIVVRVIGKTVSNQQWDVRGEFYRLFRIAAKKNHINFSAEKKIPGPAK